MALINPESSLFFTVLTLLMLIHHGFGSEVPSNPEAKLHRLLYKNEDTSDLLFCHLCTARHYSTEVAFSEPCYLRNTDAIYKINGVNYRPWCRVGAGILPTCPEPRQPKGGQVNCWKYGTRVYEVCNVTCTDRHQPLSPNITCLEENLQWSAEPSCVISECLPLNGVENVTIKCETEGPIKVGASCNVSCPPGFRPDREVVKCQKDGAWTRTPHCEPDLLPFTGDGGQSGGASISLAVLVLVVVVTVALFVILFFVWRRRKQQGIYIISTSAGKSSESGMDLPMVTTVRPSRVSAWNSISSLFRSFFHQGSLRAQEGLQRSDAESAFYDVDPDAEGEELEMLPLGGGPHSDEEGEGEGEDGADSAPGASSMPAQEGSPPSQEASPLLAAGGGSSTDQESTMGIRMSPQPADDKPAAAGNGCSGEAGDKERLGTFDLEAEVHLLSLADLEMGVVSPDEPKGFPDHIPNPLWRRRSTSSDPSDRSKPTYKYNLNEAIGFKVIYNIGGSKVSSSIIERDTEMQVTRGLDIQISAKCQDHDDEVENFSVRLLDEASGRGNVIKEAKGNSFRFRACLTSHREVYILSAQTSRTRRKNIVRYTLYTLGLQVHNDDPDETKVKELYHPPPPCLLPNCYTPLPRLIPSTSTVSNSDNQRITKESHERPPLGNSRELPGPPGGSALPSYADSFALGTLPDMGLSQEAQAPGDAGECGQSLSELMGSSSLTWITDLLHKLEPIPGRKEAMSIRGFYLHFRPDEKERLDYICWAKQGDLHCSPARVLLERLSQEGLKTGHLVSYFAQPDHRSLDLLRMLGQAHPFQSCPPCHQVVSRIT